MKIFVSSLDVPIGYVPPTFPSLYWPTKDKYDILYLYYSKDMILYFIYWSLIMFGGVYLIAGTVAAASLSFNYYENKITILKVSILNKLITVLIFFVVGLVEGLISGAVVGLLVQAIYRAGSLSMSTWIPFCWSMAEILFNICCLAPTSLVIL